MGLSFILACTIGLSTGFISPSFDIRGRRPSSIRTTPCFRMQTLDDDIAGSQAEPVDVKAKVEELSPLDLAKEDLMLALLDGLKATTDMRISVNELLIQLERLNPTESPATSSLLNGVWEIQYPGSYAPGPVDSPTRELALLVYSGGYKPGLLLQLLSKLPLQVSSKLEILDLQLTISPGAAETEAKFSVFGNDQMVSFRSDLQAASDVRLSENFNEAEVAGRKVSLPGPAKFSRELFITYLDDDLLVVRDESGIPDVLVRKEEVSPEQPSSESVVEETTGTAAPIEV